MRATVLVHGNSMLGIPDLNRDRGHKTSTTRQGSGMTSTFKSGCKTIMPPGSPAGGYSDESPTGGYSNGFPEIK